VFTIHVAADVPSLDVYEFIKKGSKGDEDEILLPGGGYFYNDASLKTEGFVTRKSGEFETWYSMRPPLPPLPVRAARTIAQLTDIIDPDEYEFIERPEDIHFDEDVSIEVKRTVFEEIQRRRGA
jgi:hypothetical protein